MRIAILFLFLSLIFTTQIQAREQWTDEQLIVFGAYTALVYLDWRQVQTISQTRKIETPFFTARSGYDDELKLFYAATVIASAVIVEIIPSSWRIPYLSLAIGLESRAVYLNWRAGLTF